MKKVFLNYRYYVMMVLGFIVILNIFGVPDESLGLMKWMVSMLITKVIGFVVGYILIKLVAHWEKKNLVPELSKLIEEE